MSISSTRRVTRSSASISRPDYKKNQIDAIDTTNNVFVNSSMDENNEEYHSKNKSQHHQKEKNIDAHLNQNRVPKIAEVIGSDELILSQNEDNNQRNHVNIYSNNQHITQNEERKSAQRFYKSEKIIDIIDELA